MHPRKPPHSFSAPLVSFRGEIKALKTFLLDNIFSGHKTWSWKVRENIRESQHTGFERETYGLGINSRSHDLTSKSEARSEKIEIANNFR